MMLCAKEPKTFSPEIHTARVEMPRNDGSK